MLGDGCIFYYRKEIMNKTFDLSVRSVWWGIKGFYSVVNENTRVCCVSVRPARRPTLGRANERVRQRHWGRGDLSSCLTSSTATFKGLQMISFTHLSAIVS